MAEKKEKPKKTDAKKTETKKKEQKKKTESKSRAKDNEIFVGRKPTMTYVLATMTQFTNGVEEVHIKSRGRSISRAVDVAEVVRNKFLNDVEVKNIKIGTEERTVEDGKKINVSTMDIVLSK